MTTALPPTANGAAWLLAFALVVTSYVCGAEREACGMKTIEGSVWYRERMALPPNAEIRVSLEDVSRMDVPSEVIATTSFMPQGGTPWDFTLKYDPQRLHEKGRYVLRARIEANGRLCSSVRAASRHLDTTLENR
jgi:putative lipoprotein